MSLSRVHQNLLGEKSQIISPILPFSWPLLLIEIKKLKTFNILSDNKHLILEGHYHGNFALRLERFECKNLNFGGSNSTQV